MAEYLPPGHKLPPTKLTVLISGSGTYLQALIDASTSGRLPSTTIVRVISNAKDVQGLTRAEKAGIPTAYHNLIFGKYLKSGEEDPNTIQKGRAEYDADLADLVLKDKPDVVVCAGWTHILSSLFLEPLASAHVPVIDLHALPEKYDGANAIQQAWNDFQIWDTELRERRREAESHGREYEVDRQEELERSRTGVMVHYVTHEVDLEEAIEVKYIDFKSGETLEELTERIHKVEHLVIVKGTRLAILLLWEERTKTGIDN